MSDDWTTPIKLFEFLNSSYDFTVDAAASAENSLCEKFYSMENSLFDNSLKGEVVFCNPPYSKAREFAQYVYFSKCKDYLLLLPVRSDRIWFQRLLHSSSVHVTWITGRLHFGNSKKGAFMYSVLFGSKNIGHTAIGAEVFNASGKGAAKT